MTLVKVALRNGQPFGTMSKQSAEQLIANSGGRYRLATQDDERRWDAARDNYAQ